MANLITLTELKSALGIDVTDTRKDATYNLVIPWASQSVINFAERDFGTPSVTETRTYPYDGSGYLDIDDASVITQVQQVVPNGTDVTLNADMWTAMPHRRDDSPVFYYILLGGMAHLGSPQMGFTRNLDVYYQDHPYLPTHPLMKVTGTWGWPEVPGDVKLATIWTISDWTAKPGGAGEGLTSEAIEGYSRSWGSRQGGPSAMLAVPNRARDLLANYTKIYV